MKTIQVVAAIILTSKQVLATQRGYGEFEGGWEFPGGKIEPGETAQEALVREIAEELNAKISVGSHLITVEYEYPDFKLIMECYFCSLESEITLLEHRASRWVTESSIDSLNWLPADIEVVEAIKESGILSE